MLSAALLLAALILAPVIGGGFGEFDYAIVEILVFSAIIAYILTSMRNRTSWVRVPGLIPMIVFIALVLISTFFTEAIYPSLRQILLILTCLGAYMLASSLAVDSKKAAALVVSVVVTALGICAVGIRHYAISTGGGAHFWSALMSQGEHMRLFGSFINPGYFAGFIVIVLPLTLGVYLVIKRPILAVFIGLAFIIETIALMLTGTKFGIVSAVGGLLIFFLLAIGTRSLRRSKFTRLFVLAVFLVPLLIVFSSPVKSRITAAETGGSQVHSTTFRVSTWQATIKMIKDHPLLGVGPGVYATAYPRYTIAGTTKAAHQSYLQLASESGVIAMIAFVLVILAAAHQSIRGIIIHQTEHVDSALKDSAHAQKTSWSDFVPFSGWRMMNCAIYGALAGSVVRNLADSDWYIIGIALPFWALMGVLAAQSGAVRTIDSPKRWAKGVICAVCVVMALLSGSFGLAGYFAPDQFDESQSFHTVFSNYKTASLISPLNPVYHREMAKFLAMEGDPAAAKRQIDRAALLAPTDSTTYYIGGMIMAADDNPKAAVEYFKKSLRCSPKSTNTLYQLSEAYRMLGDVKMREKTLLQLLKMEDSEYEILKGTPEFVDTTFARAHIYFGRKYQAEKKYSLASNEYTQAIDRLERWRSHKQMIDVAIYAGLMSKQDELDLLEQLRGSYFDLAEACDALGHKQWANEARANGEAVKVE
ncbi:O-antigen ligase family protein [bacterium]|nr:O-antigen ligase family protein [bacterium]